MTCKTRGHTGPREGGFPQKFSSPPILSHDHADEPFISVCMYKLFQNETFSDWICSQFLSQKFAPSLE